MPRVEREEFINVGVVVYCARQKFLQVKYELNEARLNALCPQLDIGELSKFLTSFEHICAGRREGGAIAALPVAERFRWLTATRSTILQTSRVHPGLCSDAGNVLQRMFDMMVGC